LDRHRYKARNLTTSPRFQQHSVLESVVSVIDFWMSDLA
jgi:hypothetical protein